MRSPWALEYARTPREYIWGTEPSSIAREVSALLPPRARVLELGCGEGRDSVYFASRGHDVTGIEVSRAGLRKAARLARTRGVDVRWVKADLARLPVMGRADLVYSCGSVHYVSRRARQRLFLRLKALTRRGGYHAHVVFTDRLVHVELGEVMDYFARDELARVYADWRILRREDAVIDCARDGTRHRHSVEMLVAQAPD